VWRKQQLLAFEIPRQWTRRHSVDIVEMNITRKWMALRLILQYPDNRVSRRCHTTGALLACSYGRKKKQRS
jgi:hypothetical protein